MSRHVDIASYTVANSEALQYQQPQSMSSRHGGRGRNAVADAPSAPKPVTVAGTGGSGPAGGLRGRPCGPRPTPPFTNRTSRVFRPPGFVFPRRTVSTPSLSTASSTSAQRAHLVPAHPRPMKRSPAITASRRSRSRATSSDSLPRPRPPRTRSRGRDLLGLEAAAAAPRLVAGGEDGRQVDVTPVIGPTGGDSTRQARPSWPVQENSICPSTLPASLPHLDQQPTVVARSPFVDAVQGTRLDGLVEPSRGEDVVELQSGACGKLLLGAVGRDVFRICGCVRWSRVCSPSMRITRSHVPESERCHAVLNGAAACVPEREVAMLSPAIVHAVVDIEIARCKDAVRYPIRVGHEYG